MTITVEQMRKYRAAWGDAARALKAGGLTPGQVEGMRRDLLLQAGRAGWLCGWTEGEEPSSTMLTNDGLDAMLKAITALHSEDLQVLMAQEQSRQRRQCLRSIALEMPGLEWLAEVVRRIYGIVLPAGLTRERLAKGEGLEKLSDEQVLGLRRKVGNGARKRSSKA